MKTFQIDSNGNIVMVESPPPQYTDTILTADESVMAVKQFKAKLHKLSLTTDETSEALRLAREKKHFNEKTSEYFRKVNHKYSIR